MRLYVSVSLTAAVMTINIPIAAHGFEPDGADALDYHQPGWPATNSLQNLRNDHEAVFSGAVFCLHGHRLRRTQASAVLS